VGGILIEMDRGRFFVGVGINVCEAPTVPVEGVDHGRESTCLNNYRNQETEEKQEKEEKEEIRSFTPKVIPPL